MPYHKISTTTRAIKLKFQGRGTLLGPIRRDQCWSNSKKPTGTSIKTRHPSFCCCSIASSLSVLQLSPWFLLTMSYYDQHQPPVGVPPPQGTSSLFLLSLSLSLSSRQSESIVVRSDDFSVSFSDQLID